MSYYSHQVQESYYGNDYSSSSSSGSSSESSTELSDHLITAMKQHLEHLYVRVKAGGGHPQQITSRLVRGTLAVTVMGATLQYGEWHDCHVAVSVDNARHYTSTQTSQCPVWDESFRLPVTLLPNGTASPDQQLHVQLYRRKFGHDESAGSSTISLQNLKMNTSKESMVSINGESVRLLLKALDFGLPPSKEEYLGSISSNNIDTPQTPHFSSINMTPMTGALPSKKLFDNHSHSHQFPQYTGTSSPTKSHFTPLLSGDSESEYMGIASFPQFPGHRPPPSPRMNEAVVDGYTTTYYPAEPRVPVVPLPPSTPAIPVTPALPMNVTSQTLTPHKPDITPTGHHSPTFLSPGPRPSMPNMPTPILPPPPSLGVSSIIGGGVSVHHHTPTPTAPLSARAGSYYVDPISGQQLDPHSVERAISSRNHKYNMIDLPLTDNNVIVVPSAQSGSSSPIVVLGGDSHKLEDDHHHHHHKKSSKKSKKHKKKHSHSHSHSNSHHAHTHSNTNPAKKDKKKSSKKHKKKHHSTT